MFASVGRVFMRVFVWESGAVYLTGDTSEARCKQTGGGGGACSGAGRFPAASRARLCHCTPQSMSNIITSTSPTCLHHCVFNIDNVGDRRSTG